MVPTKEWKEWEITKITIVLLVVVVARNSLRYIATMNLVYLAHK